MIAMLIITNNCYISCDSYASFHINEMIAMLEMIAMIAHNSYANSGNLEVLFKSKNKIKEIKTTKFKTTYNNSKD